jgi:hypothetical protein
MNGACGASVAGMFEAVTKLFDQKMIAADATHKLARNLRPSDEKRIGLPSSVDFGTQIERRKAAKNSI